MENYQLFRTNILLSGQLKWDLILDSDDEELIVKDFHLSPISPSAPQNKYVEENLLNYSHQENLKQFYKKTEGTFFDNCLDPRLKHDWVVLGDDKTIIYEDTYEAGAKNATYSLYNKPIEIFCPIWLEHVTENILFVIDICNKSGKKMVSKSVNPMKGKFGQYLYDYIKFLGLTKGVEDVLDIDLKNKTATLTGISLESGNIIKKDISDLVHNLLHRERPLLEFDSMLINNFPNNKIITRQLFNFCLYFDLNDLLNSKLSSMMYGDELRFVVKTYVDGNELEKRDFYSNYEFIPKESAAVLNLSDILNEQQVESKNVLDYLYDYNYVNYINKNKYIQNTVHWSLNKNNEYIFNIYNGFGPFDLNNIYSHQYGNSPDLTIESFDKNFNNSSWINSVKINSDEVELLKQTILTYEDYNKLKNKSSDIKPLWINNILYNVSDMKGFEWDELRMLIFISESDEVFNGLENVMRKKFFGDYKKLIDGLYYVRFKTTDDFCGLIVRPDSLNYVTYANFVNLLNNISNNSGHEAYNKINEPGHPLYYIKKKLESVNQVPLVAMNRSLYITKASSPSISTKEIEYYKNDNASIEECYVLRYDGKIKPTFITEEDSGSKNLKYFKTEISEKDYLKSEFIKYSNSKYPPLYPSIKYCAIEKDKQNFSKWMGVIPAINPELEFELTSKRDESGEYVKIKDLIIEHIKTLYPKLNPYNVYNMYNVSISYDYKTLYNINEYVYKIKMILK